MSAVEELDKAFTTGPGGLFATGLRHAERLDALEAENKRLTRQLSEHDDAVGMVRSLTADNERLRAELATARNDALEAWTFVDAVSAMGFPSEWSYVAEEARRILALKSTQPGEPS